MRLICIPLAAILCTLTVGSALAAETDGAGSARVEMVQLDLVWEDVEPSRKVAEEVHDAIARTLELALMEQLEGSVARIEANKEQITATLSSVIDLALSKRGMKLADLSISPGEITLCRITIQLSGDKIKTFAVEFRFRSDTPLLRDITSADRTGLEAALAEALGGTPYSDASWVERMALSEVRAWLQNQTGYTDFDPLILVLPAETTRVYVTLMPRDGVLVVERHFVKIRSSTMLNLQVNDAGGVVSANLQALHGLPVSFVEAKADLVEGYLTREIEFAKPLQIMEPVAKAELFTVKEDISLIYDVESTRFRLGATGRVDINREEGEARFDFTAGVRLGQSADAFFHGVFYPGQFELRPQLGLAARKERFALLEGGYDYKLNSPFLRGRVNIAEDFYVSGEYYVKSQLKDENEYGITYIFRNYYEFKLMTDFRDELFASVGVRI
jgi:hypothetical protein